MNNKSQPASYINLCRAEFILENIRNILQVLCFFNTAMAHVVEILHSKLCGPFCPTYNMLVWEPGAYVTNAKTLLTKSF